MINRVTLVAIGVHGNSRREVLALRVSNSETGPIGPAFSPSSSHDLSGSGSTSKAHPGPVQAIHRDLTRRCLVAPSSVSSVLSWLSRQMNGLKLDLTTTP